MRPTLDEYARAVRRLLEELAGVEVERPIKSTWEELVSAYELVSRRTAEILDAPPEPDAVVPAGDVFEALRAFRDAGGAAWDKIDDPEAYLGRKSEPDAVVPADDDPWRDYGGEGGGA